MIKVMRSPLLLIAAALGAGLSLAAPSAYAQEGIVATVDGKPITEADLALAEREMGANPDMSPEEARRVLVEFLIQRQVLAAAAEQEKLDAGADFDQRLAYARRGQLQQLFLDKQAREAVTEADAKQVYDEQVAGSKPEEEVLVRQILLEREVPAKAMRERIVKGADFATLAKAVSADPESARSGGDLGWRTRSELPDKLAAAAFALEKKGDLSPPVETEAGWHVLMLEDRRMRTVPTFAKLKDHIVRLLAQDKARELTRELRAKANVVYNDPGLQPAPAASPTAAAAPSP